ncbi:uncharacterized protein LOC113234555 isoform X3 [Hyposmocoma kahamanoa]|uniref:uncharacterized protein LOC113234555 isoform X3 n=1 Tax=Hyposmocoma kahamanoa TaxID=1477025 RepID=UPI000E6D5CD7|nr:uncharacterized protein LOC113234555 isoform X3 [Hyposmocoma kahamanoa]
MTSRHSLTMHIQIHLTVAGSIYTATTTKKPSDEQDYTRQSHTKYPLLINIQAFRTSSGRQRKIAPMLKLHTSNQFLSEFLTLLPSAMKLDPPDVRDFRPPSKKEGISWSYYDDSMSFAINR